MLELFDKLLATVLNAWNFLSKIKHLNKEKIIREFILFNFNVFIYDITAICIVHNFVIAHVNK